VLSMLHWLKSQQSHRTVWWLYGARNHNEHPFAEEARRLLAALPNCRRYIVYSKPGPDDKIGDDFDAAGHLDIAVLEQLRVPKESDFYLCGPAAFLNTFTAGLKEWGVEPQGIHSETFGPAASFAPAVIGEPRSRSGLPRPAQGSGPRIAFVRSGVNVAWDHQQYSSLLELAEAFDIPVRWSCRTGVCHTCECSIVGGDVDYSPEPVEPPAVGNVLICCARPKTDLQLDL
jgi:ferredoxin-NADP reductase